MDKDIREAFTNLATLIDQHSESLQNEAFTNLATLIARRSESLQNELHVVQNELHGFRTEVLARFDTQSARLERHGGLLRGGSVQITRLVEWSEKIDAAMEAKDKQIAALEERVKKLETQIKEGD